MITITVEQMLNHISRYYKVQFDRDQTIVEIWRNLPVRELHYVLRLYEEAVFILGEDYFGNKSIFYFDDRIKDTTSDPTLSDINKHYTKIRNEIELINKIPKNNKRKKK